MKKRILSFILCIVIIVSVVLSGCKQPARDITGDTPLAKSIVYANSLSNKVQGYFNGKSRTSYTLENNNAVLINDLTDSKLTTLTNKDGDAYFTDTLDYFIKDKDGEVYYSSLSNYGGRVNTLRLGYYYYDSHVYDMTFNSNGAYSATKTSDIGKFDEGDYSVFQDVDVRTENNELIMEYEEGSLGLITVEKKNISLEIDMFSSININMGGGAIGVLLNPYINGFATDVLINVTPGTPIDLKEYGFEGKKLTGYKISFMPEGTYTTLSIKATEIKAQPRAISLDKAAHFYSDKYHQEMHIVTQEAMSNLDSMGMEIRLNKADVKKKVQEDGFVGFDIKGVGVLGVILPSDDSVDSCIVTEQNDFYILTISKILPTTVPKEFHQRFGVRIYTDDTHSFEGLEATAKEERSPITDVVINGENTDNAEFLEYDYIRGMYRFDMDGSHFNKAFYEEPDKYYMGDISMINNELSRSAYIWFNTSFGCLESAAITDKNNTLVPIPLQVGKNFGGEMEESLYLNGDPQYGDTIFPLSFDAGETLSFKLMNLYQNWGVTPLKQISSIQFVCSYYHLSTGATESNCIAPYFFNGSINTLPDFRCRSGIMWSGQPQFNSVGMPSFVTSETYTDSVIDSYGPTYADITYSYEDAEEGLYRYFLRHVEFPQTDENRTYYTITIEFLKNGEVDGLSFAHFDSTDTNYDNISYLNSENKEIEFETSDLYGGKGLSESLSDEGGFVGLYNMTTSSSSTRGCNVSYIVKDINGKLNGKEYTDGVKFHLSVNSATGSTNFSLAPDVDTVKFKKGDKLTIDLILLPWGSHEDEGNATTEKVRQDSVINPADVEAIVGEVIEDTWVPTVKCMENTAEFTLSGSDNNNAVRVTDFTKLGQPAIEIKTEDGSWREYVVGNDTYDGYTVFYNNVTGNYDYAFIWQEPGIYRVNIK